MPVKKGIDMDIKKIKKQYNEMASSFDSCPKITMYLKGQIDMYNYLMKIKKHTNKGKIK